MGKFGDVIDLYKSKFHYRDSLPRKFEFLRNLRDRQRMNRPHHCDDCNRTPSTNCFKKLHLAFCLAPVRGEEGVTAYCGERFTVDSKGGCWKHPYGNGGEINKIFKEAAYSGASVQDCLERHESNS
jgi:hypothetical protein